MSKVNSATKITEIAGKKKGRNRSKAADEAILKATLMILADQGYANLTANEVITRAGVSSATLYRRWNSLGDLAVAAVQTLGPQPVLIDNGSFDTDIAEFITYLGETMSRNNLTGDLSGKGAKVDRELRAIILKVFVSPQKEILAKILANAMARKEVDSIPPIDDCWSYVSGPIHHRIYIREEPFTPEFANSLSTLICMGIKALALT